MTAGVVYAVLAALLLADWGRLIADDRAAGRKHAKDMKALETPKAPPAPRAGAE